MVAVVRAVITAEPHARRTPVVNHGDFGPQNVLFVGSEVSGVLDFEDARIADPLLDVAWWNWLVRTHTPQAFERGWRRFVAAAGNSFSPGDEVLAADLRRIIIFRLLETAEHSRFTQPEKHPSWARRLQQELSVPLAELVI